LDLEKLISYFVYISKGNIEQARYLLGFFITSVTNLQEICPINLNFVERLDKMVAEQNDDIALG